MAGNPMTKIASLLAAMQAVIDNADYVGDARNQDFIAFLKVANSFDAPTEDEKAQIASLWNVDHTAWNDFPALIAQYPESVAPVAALRYILSTGHNQVLPKENEETLALWRVFLARYIDSIKEVYA
jgi:hypothetical protein